MDDVLGLTVIILALIIVTFGVVAFAINKEDKDARH